MLTEIGKRREKDESQSAYIRDSVALRFELEDCELLNDDGTLDIEALDAATTTAPADD